MSAALRNAKERSPRWAKDVANTATRRFAVLTAGSRPLPDFLIVGTKRGGTTSMWNWLVEHPGVVGMYPEVRGSKSSDYFFDGGVRGERWYRSHFHTRRHREALEERRGHRVVTGEASPLYMYDPRVCAQVVTLMPRIKVIVQLRNPVDRAFSHWQERVQQQVEPLSFRAALDAEEQRTSGELERMLADPAYYSQAFDWFSYRDRGVYEPQVARWLGALPSSQVHIVNSEEFSADEQGVMNGVSDFLGVPRYERQGFARHNLSTRAAMDEATRAELGRFYRPHNARLYELIERDLNWD